MPDSKRGVDVVSLPLIFPINAYPYGIQFKLRDIDRKRSSHLGVYTLVHSKTFVVDDLFAVVGTINLDYRSLFLHFECGVWMYNTKCVLEVKKDYIDTLEICHNITLEDCGNIKWYRRLAGTILKIFAPLM